jgi:hypothetical protein
VDASQEIWAVDPSRIRCTLCSQRPDIRALEDAFCEIVARDAHSPNFALRAPAGATVSWCVTVANGAVRLVEDPEELLEAALVLQIGDVDGSPVEDLISARLFFGLCLAKGARPSEKVRALLEERLPPAAEVCEALFPRAPGARLPADFPFALAFPEMRGWTEVHSTIIGLCERFDSGTFAQLPLSARFTFETAAFVHARIAPIGDARGFTFGLARVKAPGQRLAAEFAASADWIATIQADLSGAFATDWCCPRVRQLLFGCILEWPLVSVFLLMTFLGRDKPGKFAIISTNGREVIAVLPTERAIVIGEFTEREQFVAALLSKIQQYTDLHFV